MQHTVGISQYKTASARGDVLVTYSLGSCIGLSLYDPEAGVGGLVHCMLPLSKLDPEKAKAAPGMFVDTGVSALLRAMYDQGAAQRRIVAKAAGAASLLDENGVFRIGERNHTVLRKMLWKNNILIAAEDVGGSGARTMYLHIDSGRTVVRSGGREWDL